MTCRSLQRKFQSFSKEVDERLHPNLGPMHTFLTSNYMLNQVSTECTMAVKMIKRLTKQFIIKTSLVHFICNPASVGIKVAYMEAVATNQSGVQLEVYIIVSATSGVIIMDCSNIASPLHCKWLPPEPNLLI